jgi:hypothetical protein
MVNIASTVNGHNITMAEPFFIPDAVIFSGQGQNVQPYYAHALIGGQTGSLKRDAVGMNESQTLWDFQSNPITICDDGSCLVLFENLPEDIHITRVLERIRGVSVLSATVVDTRSLSGPGKSMSAVVLFASHQGALKYVEQVRQPNFGFLDSQGNISIPCISLISSQTHPYRRMKMVRMLSLGVTRRIRIDKFPKKQILPLLAANKIAISRLNHSSTNITLIRYEGENLELEFASIETSYRVFGSLVNTSRFGYYRKGGQVVRYRNDACSRLAEELHNVKSYQPAVFSGIAEFFEEIELEQTFQSLHQSLTPASHSYILQNNIAPNNTHNRCIGQTTGMKSSFYSKTSLESKLCKEMSQLCIHAETSRQAWTYKEPETGVEMTRLPFRWRMTVGDYWKEIEHRYLNSEDPDWIQILDNYYVLHGLVNLRKLLKACGLKDKPPAPANLWGILKSAR